MRWQPSPGTCTTSTASCSTSWWICSKALLAALALRQSWRIVWGLVICIKMFTNVYLNKVLFIPCEVISLHPRRLMLSESPAVGSVHGHRVGRTSAVPPGMDCERRWTLTGASWTPPTSSAPTASVPELESKDTAAACRPPPHPHRAGQEQLWFESYSGLKRRTDVSARLCLLRGPGPGTAWIQRLWRRVVISVVVPLPAPRAPRTSEGRKPRRCRRRRSTRDPSLTAGPCRPTARAQSWRYECEM